ncbi:hypothetical protein IWX78_001336 [Mycetocola sp. CAN_C7]
MPRRNYTRGRIRPQPHGSRLLFLALTEQLHQAWQKPLTNNNNRKATS